MKPWVVSMQEISFYDTLVFAENELEAVSLALIELKCILTKSDFMGWNGRTAMYFCNGYVNCVRCYVSKHEFKTKEEEAKWNKKG